MGRSTNINDKFKWLKLRENNSRGTIAKKMLNCWVMIELLPCILKYHTRTHKLRACLSDLSDTNAQLTYVGKDRQILAYKWKNTQRNGCEWMSQQSITTRSWLNYKYWGTHRSRQTVIRKPTHKHSYTQINTNLQCSMNAFSTLWIEASALHFLKHAHFWVILRGSSNDLLSGSTL